MKNNIFRLCILTGMALGLWSCQETEIVVPRVKEIVSDRVVLIEDFTGVQCTNCPNASREISSLAHKYNGNVVAIAYHTDFLGLPITKDGYKSKYNFTTPDGNLLEEEMGGYQGKPAVTLNRKLYDAQQEYLLTSSSILGNIESELRSIPRVVIDIENQYDAETRKLRTKVDIKPQAVASGDFRLHVCITEDKIIDSQIDNIVYVKDYEHNHVFRTMLSALAGDILGTDLVPGSNFSRTYEYTLPPEAGWWVASHCNVVAFVTDLSQKAFNVGAVLQAAEKHVIE